jgi:hypothetical protein
MKKYKVHFLLGFLMLTFSFHASSQQQRWSGIGKGPCSNFRSEGEQIRYAPEFPKNAKMYNFLVIIKHPGRKKADYAAATMLYNLKCERIQSCFPNADDDHEIFCSLPAGQYILSVGVFHFHLETVKFKVPFKGDLIVTPTWMQ